MATPSLPDYASNTGVVRHVSVTQKLASGTEIADITVNGKKTTIYAPNSTGPSQGVPSAGFLLADDGNTRKVRNSIADSDINASTGAVKALGIRKDSSGNAQIILQPKETWIFEDLDGNTTEKTVYIEATPQ